MHSIRTHLLGYPRIGEQRELKKATEAYWTGSISRAELIAMGRRLREQNWRKQQAAQIDFVSVNDFSFYDQMLDLTCLVGNVPPRFGWKGGDVDLDTQFLIARGARANLDHEHKNGECAGCEVTSAASEMTKWFDTNYHYIVPEFHAQTTFALSSTKVFDELAEAQALGLRAKPVLIGPVTYLTLGKVLDGENPNFDRFRLLERLLPVYERVISQLAEQGATWIQMDEPIFALNLSPGQRESLMHAYSRLQKAAGSARLLVATYFGELRDNLPLLLNLPVAAIHIDAVRGAGEVGTICQNFPQEKELSLGIVDGRNIWKNDFAMSLALLRQAQTALGGERLWVAPSCSLLHAPITLGSEKKFDATLKSWLAFADEKMVEVSILRELLQGGGDRKSLELNQIDQLSRRTDSRIHNHKVRERINAIQPEDYNRRAPFTERQKVQRKRLNLPLFPTTTIGSFPQTNEVRSARAKWKKGDLTEVDYDRFIKGQIQECVLFQDQIGIDMPVHGEFERNDMVEYFGERLSGFAFSQNGWVQSYGSRCVKPPLIFGDVERPRPMTTYWSEYAQTLTKRPMKGMLTGPITILQWSFVRNDQPRTETARQIALAIRDEVIDLEKIGLAAIQIDEPALREGLPLRRSDWSNYLEWAVKAFRLCASGIRNETQIHTHMCYAEFNDIIRSIADLDADVITIETSRSNMELLKAFVDFNYPNEIGPGVYDIHSPRIPTVGEMEGLMHKAEKVIATPNLWVNPDCGLKTRQWSEVKTSLMNMVEAARRLRDSHHLCSTEVLS